MGRPHYPLHNRDPSLFSLSALSLISARFPSSLRRPVVVCSECPPESSFSVFSRSDRSPPNQLLCPVVPLPITSCEPKETLFFSSLALSFLANSLSFSPSRYASLFHPSTFQFPCNTMLPFSPPLLIVSRTFVNAPCFLPPPPFFTHPPHPPLDPLVETRMA